MQNVKFTKDDYFKIDVECHLYPSIDHLAYFPGMRASNKGIDGVYRALGISREEVLKLTRKGGWGGGSNPEWLIALMDKYGIDMACVMREDVRQATGFSSPFSTNGYVMEACEKYPDRFIFMANVCPIIVRGVKNAIWELEYLVKEKNCKLVKYIGTGDTHMDDPQLWPFYEKVTELQIPVCFHTGGSWLPPGRGKNCLPIQIDAVSNDFPEMTIIAYHAGWPHNHELNLIAAGHVNVHISLSLLVPWCATAPRRAAKIIGEAIQFAGVDRVIWGTDYFGPGAELLLRLSVEGFREFQIPEDLQQGYGFWPLSKEDKRKIFGENLAKLLGIKPKRRGKV